MWFVPLCTSFSRWQYMSNENLSGLIVLKYQSFKVLRTYDAIKNWYDFFSSQHFILHSCHFSQQFCKSYPHATMWNIVSYWFVLFTNFQKSTWKSYLVTSNTYPMKGRETSRSGGGHILQSVVSNFDDILYFKLWLNTFIKHFLFFIYNWENSGNIGNIIRYDQ